MVLPLPPAIGNREFDMVATGIDRTDYSSYESPEAVLDDAGLDDGRKVLLLTAWEEDVRERMVAAEENMPAADDAGGEADIALLTRLRACLRQLGDFARDDARPTKHGG